MANIKSQIKRIGTNEKARQRNAAAKSRLRAAAIKVEFAVEANVLANAGDDFFFYDVKGNFAESSINALCKMGIINGNNGYFEPDANIQYIHAVKMLVCALGYDIIAQENGGYPYGYLMTATNLKLLQ